MLPISRYIESILRYLVEKYHFAHDLPLIAVTVSVFVVKAAELFSAGIENAKPADWRVLNDLGAGVVHSYNVDRSKFYEANKVYTGKIWGIKRDKYYKNGVRKAFNAYVYENFPEYTSMRLPIEYRKNKSKVYKLEREIVDECLQYLQQKFKAKDIDGLCDRTLRKWLREANMIIYLRILYLSENIHRKPKKTKH